MILKWQQLLFNLVWRKNIWKEVMFAKWVISTEISISLNWWRLDKWPKLGFHSSSRFHQRKVAFVLRIFPWLSFTLWYHLLLNAERSSRIWLLFISKYVEHYADSILTSCVLFLVIEHSHSRDFYKFVACHLKKILCSCWRKCFWSRVTGMLFILSRNIESLEAVEEPI